MSNSSFVWKGDFCEVLEQIVCPEIVKRTVGVSVRIRKTSAKILWRSRPPRKLKKKQRTGTVWNAEEGGHPPLEAVTKEPNEGRDWEHLSDW
jgi:hypothetical protein